MEHDWFDDLKAIRDCEADADTKHLLLVLHTFVRQDSCWPSVATIAKCLGVSERQAQYRLAKAKEAAWIKATPQFKNGVQTSNRITLNYAKAYGQESVGVQSVAGEGCNGLHPGGAMDCVQNYQLKLEKKKSGVSWSADRGFHGDGLESLRATWISSYPQVDIDAELRAMSAWLISNKPRYKDYARFINGWLRRQSERAKEGRSNASRGSRGPGNVGTIWDTDTKIAASVVKFG